MGRTGHVNLGALEDACTTGHGHVRSTLSDRTQFAAATQQSLSVSASLPSGYRFPRSGQLLKKAVSLLTCSHPLQLWEPRTDKTLTWI